MGIMNWLIRIGLDATQVETGLTKARSAGQKFARDFKNEVSGTLAGVFTVGAVAAFAKSVVNMADEIGDLAEQFNLTTEEVQRLQILAGQTGVSFEKMSSAVLKMNEAREKALEDDNRERQAFLAMGVKLDDLKNRNVTNLELVKRIGQAYVDAGKPLDFQTRIADLLSVKLVAAAGAIAQIDKMGPVSLVSDEEIRKLGEFNDKLDELVRKSKVAAAPILGAAAAELSNFLNASGQISKITGATENQSSALLLAMRSLGGGVGSLISSAIEKRLAESNAGSDGMEFQGPLQSLSAVNPAKQTKTKEDFPFRGFLGGTQDPLARVGGFTMFGASQDRIVRELRDHGKLLRDIKRANETVAQEVKS